MKALVDNLTYTFTLDKPAQEALDYLVTHYRSISGFNVGRSDVVRRLLTRESKAVKGNEGPPTW
jgi:hypothetical protein